MGTLTESVSALAIGILLFTSAAATCELRYNNVDVPCGDVTVAHAGKIERRGRCTFNQSQGGRLETLVCVDAGVLLGASIYANAALRTPVQLRSVACLRRAVVETDHDLSYFRIQDRLEAALLSRACRKPLAVIVGANDGLLADRLMPIVIGHTWPALLVEPMSIAFDRLQRNMLRVAGVTTAAELREVWPGLRLVELAVTAVGAEGRVEMAVELGPSNNDGTAHLVAAAPQRSSPTRTLHTVEGESFLNILAAAGLTCDAIDVLQIDVEGHDFAVLSQLPPGCHPKVIVVEALTQDKMDDIVKWMEARGYVISRAGDRDVVAVDETWFEVRNVM